MNSTPSGSTDNVPGSTSPPVPDSTNLGDAGTTIGGLIGSRVMSGPIPRPLGGCEGSRISVRSTGVAWPLTRGNVVLASVNIGESGVN